MSKSFSIALLALLALTAVAQHVVLASSSLATTVIAPPGRTVILEPYHNGNQNNFLGNGAQWIWVNGSDGFNNGFVATFQTLFFVDCPQEVAELRITADNVFAVYLNGAQVAKGDNWRQLYSFKTQLTCGLNNLTIAVTNLDQGSPGALIFSLIQEQNNCYKCSENPSAFYNRNKCRCECSTQCSCPSRAQRWTEYPTCGCQCNKQILVPCDQTIKFWNERRCECECKKKWCPEGQVQDQQSCKCVDCQPQKCFPGQFWNSETCECEFKVDFPTQLCPPNKIWSPVDRTCVCPPRFALCLPSEIWDQASCSCLPLLK